MNTILVCDDERDIVSALRIYLEAEGYRVLTAYDGREALNIIAQEEVQLVLLDIMMPELDGLHVLTALREEHNIPVILLTAKSEDADKVLGLNIGADDYVTKPFNPVELLARVRSQLRRYLKLGAGGADTARIRHSLAADAQRGHGVFAARDLPPTVAGGADRGGKGGGGAHPSPAGKAGDQPRRAALAQGRVGKRL